jgi:DNA-binding transcriptional regulator YhcF (GntR family)
MAAGSGGIEFQASISGAESVSSALGQIAAKAGLVGTETQAAAQKSTSALEQMAAKWGNISNSMQVVGQAFSAFTQLATGAFNSVVSSSAGVTQSLNSLAGVAGNLGVNADAAKKAAQSLAADGMMTLSDASSGLKSLLASGLNLDTATALLAKNKDAAVENRQAHYGLSESIRVFSEGFKGQLKTHTRRSSLARSRCRIWRPG